MKKIIKLFNFEIKGINEEEFTIDGIFSTANEDRHGDIVVQNWDLKSFLKNPVILNSHNYNDATEVIGKITDIVADKKLEGTIKFAVNENPKAKIIYELYAGGFLNAFSVGFIPKQFDDKGKILESELLEISAVSVPANAQALAKQKGINIDLLLKQEDDNNKDDNGGEEDDDNKHDEGEDETDDKRDDVEDTGEQGDDTEAKGDTEVEEKIEDIEIDEGSKKTKVLSHIVRAVKVLSELKEIDTRGSVRAKNQRLINKAIRDLFKIK